MRKVLKDTKSLLLENMAKLNPDFKINQSLLIETEDKWIQGAVNPEHKGFCTPMSKKSCTPKRKALARRFKKGIDENIDSMYDEDSPEYIKAYQAKIDRLKSFIEGLINQGEYDIIDTLYRLLIDRKQMSPVGVNEDYSPQYQDKAEKIKGKIDFLFDTNHYDLLDKIDNILLRLFPDDGTEVETELA